MKILLVGINSKYIHTCLSIRYLKMYSDNPNVDFVEYTINEQISSVTADIYKQKPDVILFSCYIWNITFVSCICDNLSKIMPNLKIIFGGPEVTYNANQTLNENTFADAVIRGEGEQTFKELLENNFNYKDILGVTYRDGDNIISNNDRPLICDISEIPFPYTDEDMIKNSGKLIYYESSRGCPFRCSYCLSSTVHSVRYRDIEIVKNEILFFIKHKVPVLKFVDRTFNADRKRTYELLKFMIDNHDETTFHFEIAADLINDDIFNLLKTAPYGVFQLEIGVQSTNEDTIRAIDRKTDFEKIKETVNKLMSLGTIHLHLDLIAGLPYENLETFKKSFDDVFSLKPHVLQLGFLKLLRGTKIRTQEQEFNYKFNSQPTYEILSNDFLSYEDVLLLKAVEDVFEKYNNSGVFENSINYLLNIYNSPFDLFYDISKYFEVNNLDRVPHAQKTLYKYLLDFYNQNFDDERFCDYLKYDYFIHNKGGNTPDWSIRKYDTHMIAYRFNFLNDDNNIKTYFPDWVGIKAKDIIKHMRFEVFKYKVMENGETEDNIIVFDYKHNKTMQIPYYKSV